MVANSSRARKVAEQIQRDLSIIIQQEVKDPRIGMVTINDVRVSVDLAYAEVYFTCMSFSGAPQSADQATVREQQTTLLNRAAGFIRSRLASGLKLRIIPQLRFHYDAVIESGARLSQLIDDAISQDQQRTDSS